MTRYPRLIKGLRIAFSATCGMACVLLVVLWVRSYFIADRLHLPVGAKEAIAVASKQGKLFLLRYETVPQPNAWQAGLYSHSTADELSFPMGDVSSNSRLGFGIMHRPPYSLPELKEQVVGKPGVITIWNSGVMFLKGYAVMFPAWFLTLVTAVIAVAPWISRRFSLRTLLLATTLVAVVLGAAVWAAK
jgi:hypothetical protein